MRGETIICREPAEGDEEENRLGEKAKKIGERKKKEDKFKQKTY